ncbi:hypothetical protein DINM_001557 [Dirofilaria immitis]|nr:hypothetical protein [Dirofilaria immitis]
MQMLISLAVITAARLHSIFSSAENNMNYWIELELQTVHWKPTCLTTGGCSNPRFRISKSNKFNAEIISISWSITENFVERHSRKFITHWMHGKPHEITLQCDVIGMDPLYGFLRTCDTTQNIEIFNEKDETEESNNYPRTVSDDELSTNERHGKLIVEIRAKCFNASFAAQKYMKHCPWCTTQDGMTFIETASEHESIEDVTAKMGSVEKFMQAFIVVSKQRHSISVLQKRSQLLQPPTHLNSYLYSEQLAKPAKNVNHRYDVPWDQKCFLQRFWINENPNIGSGNAIIGSRMLNRTSTPLAYIPRKTTITGTISTMSKRLSPNSSVYEHHEDSGLDSV